MDKTDFASFFARGQIVLKRQKNTVFLMPYEDIKQWLETKTSKENELADELANKIVLFNMKWKSKNYSHFRRLMHGNNTLNGLYVHEITQTAEYKFELSEWAESRRNTGFLLES